MPDWIAVIILGIVEGITEFLPISSTGHLLLVEQWLPRQTDLFNVVIQAGAVLAVLPLFPERLSQFVHKWREAATRDYLMKLLLAFFLTVVGVLILEKVGGAYELTDTQFKDLKTFAGKLSQPTDGVSRYLWSRLSKETQTQLATVAAGQAETIKFRITLAEELNQILAGEPLYDQGRFGPVRLSVETQKRLQAKQAALLPLNRLLLEDAYPLEIAKHPKGLKLPEKVTPVGLALLFGGLGFVVVEWWLKKRQATAEITWTIAVVVGVGQLLAATFPGLSRSGATILVALVLGLNRPAATEFSFLVGIPTMMAASGYKILKALHHPPPGVPAEHWGLVLVGAVASAIVSFLVVKWLLRYVQTHTFTIFGWYRIALGGAILVFG